MIRNIIKKKFSFKFDPKQHNYINEIIFNKEETKLPVYQAVDFEGNIKTEISSDIKNKLKNCLFNMIKVEVIDTILNKSQRQGRISFYMTSHGEIATTIGVPAGLNDDDLIFPQYREHGSLIYRGFKIKEITDNCVGNYLCCNLARQMPIHYTSKKLSFANVSSPLGTQIPHAVGAGYSMALNNENRLAITYFGEGSASEGDCLSALNFAGVLGGNTLFVLRNNKYAISTPSTDQYKTEGLAERAKEFGVKSIKIDGNDIISVMQATKEAREYIIKNQRPIFIESLTYRVGDHSTSDYSALYRDLEEVESWKTNNDPIKRTKSVMKKLGLKICEKEIKEYEKEVQKEIVSSLKQSFKEKKPNIKTLFEDVYDKMTPQLEKQYKDLMDHVKRNPDVYNLDDYHN